jgi:hypothetical protein
MVFNIEISINLMKHSNVTEIENEVVGLAKEYNCEDVYTFSEAEWDSKLSICKSILVFTFSKDNMMYFLDFIKIMKKNKDIHIECIYNDELLTKLIYASSNYQKTTHKIRNNQHKSFKRSRSFSEEEKMILKLFN